MNKTATPLLSKPAATYGSALALDRTSVLGNWPAVLMVVLVMGAALFAFSPRPTPPFPPTRIAPDRLLIDGIARSGTRLLAAGELGTILIADSPSGPWTIAKVEPQRGSTFTQVLFVDDKLALAVGHDSWIVRSEDGGQSWKEVNFNAEQSEPLLGIAGPFHGKLFAFGGFGQMLVSGDLGKSWQPQTIDTATPAVAAPKTAVAPADPYGADATDDGGAGRHFNGMVQLGDGSLLLVGEKGLMMKSGDGGAHWKLLPAVYNGSFFGALMLPSQTVLVYGMRAHVFISHDNGKTWQAGVTPGQMSLFGGTVTTDGAIYLVGDGNTVLKSKDGGAHFSLAVLADQAGVGTRGGLAAVLPLSGSALLTAGENGVGIQKLALGETAARSEANP
ncbi:MAG: hypothetical protein JWR16_3422 [Nevskia sp.]|nr:hypothetical protein [Nevskia sp.]